MQDAGRVLLLDVARLEVALQHHLRVALGADDQVIGVQLRVDTLCTNQINTCTYRITA